MPDAMQIWVPGIPRPKGSMRPFKHSKTGKAMMKHSGKHMPSWENWVKACACDAWTGDVLAGPVELGLTFEIARPMSHYGTGRNVLLLKANAPQCPITIRTGDIDKLARTILDALTGIVYADDSQVVSLSAHKAWGAKAGVTIHVTAAETDAP